MSVAIRVEGLSKRYVLRHQRHGRYTALRDVLAEGAKNLGRRLLGGAGRGAGGAPDREPFWALRDVSFEVEEGTRLGIIGRNGAGKSTLLKLLSRVTEPTAGRITLRGRVSSLLEVGTGFHPELTGRENIYLNGSILGMRLAEIRRKFDEIVAFAEVERFLDTPVKRYSSGMYVRLAFSVAAHLEPEILVVDEVLAVGDAQFQKKCLGKMEEVGRGGRTVLFVSHNMDAVLSLCNQGILLKEGSIARMGSIAEVVGDYRRRVAELNYSVETCLARGGSGGARVLRVWVADAQGAAVSAVTSDQPVMLCLEAEVEEVHAGGKALDVGFGVDDADGRRLFTTVSSWNDETVAITGHSLRVGCLLDRLPLVPGRYLISVSLVFQNDTLDSIVHCGAVDILPGGGPIHANRARDHGDLDLPCRFRMLA